MIYTSANLLSNVKQKAVTPDSQTLWSDANILKVADEKIRAAIVPAVLATREDYYLTYVDYSTPATEYRIPRDAIGMKVSRVAFVDNDGTEWPCYRVSNVVDSYDQDNYAFFIQKNTIVFDVLPTKSVRVYYHVRPLSLIPTTSSMQVVSVADPSVEVNAVPSSIVAGQTLNAVSQYPGYDTILEGNPITGILSTTLTMTRPVTEVSVGDWMSPDGYTPVVQIPMEMQMALEWMVINVILASIGDQNGVAIAAQMADSAVKDAITLLQPRVDGASRKIIRKDCGLRQYGDRFATSIWIRS